MRNHLAIRRTLIEVIRLEARWKRTLKFTIWQGKYGCNIFGISLIEWRWKYGTQKQVKGRRAQQRSFGQSRHRGAYLRREALTADSGSWPREREAGTAGCQRGLGRRVFFGLFVGLLGWADDRPI
jgi:hypothetical protein